MLEHCKLALFGGKYVVFIFYLQILCHPDWKKISGKVKVASW